MSSNPLGINPGGIPGLVPPTDISEEQTTGTTGTSSTASTTPTSDVVETYTALLDKYGINLNPRVLNSLLAAYPVLPAPNDFAALEKLLGVIAAFNTRQSQRAARGQSETPGTEEGEESTESTPSPESEGHANGIGRNPDDDFGEDEGPGIDREPGPDDLPDLPPGGPQGGGEGPDLPDLPPAVFEPLVATQETEGLAWFASNPMVAFVVNYFEMISMLRELKLVENKTEVKALSLVISLAEDAAEAIIASAQKEANMHIAMACVAGAQAAITIGIAAGTGMGNRKADSAYKEEVAKVKTQIDTKSVHGTKDGVRMTPEETSKVEQRYQDLTGPGGRQTFVNSYTQRHVAYMQQLNSMNTALSTMAENFIQANFKVQKAKIDALREVISGFQQVIRKQMESSSESYRTATDLVAQVLQNLQKMIDETMKSFGINPKSSV